MVLGPKREAGEGTKMGFSQIWAEMDPFWDQILVEIGDFAQDFGRKMFPVPFFSYSLGATGPESGGLEGCPARVMFRNGVLFWSKTRVWGPKRSIWEGWGPKIGS